MSLDNLIGNFCFCEVGGRILVANLSLLGLKLGCGDLHVCIYVLVSLTEIMRALLARTTEKIAWPLRVF
jgi:hypothetical protein